MVMKTLNISKSFTERLLELGYRREKSEYDDLTYYFIATNNNSIIVVIPSDEEAFEYLLPKNLNATEYLDTFIKSYLNEIGYENIYDTFENTAVPLYYALGYHD